MKHRWVKANVGQRKYWECTLDDECMRKVAFVCSVDHRSRHGAECWEASCRKHAVVK